MARSISVRRRLRSLLLVLTSLLALAALPAQKVGATLIPQPIDDTLTSFATGTFQRTALSSLQGTAPDQTGAVQLARSGVLKDWRTSARPLPERLGGAGAIALGNRVYVIGGNAASTGQDSDEVYWTTIDPASGTPTNPNNDPNGLPWLAQRFSSGVQVVGSELTPRAGADCTQPITRLNRAAVTSVSTGGNGGYIYVMGGNISCAGAGTINVSSYATFIGSVNGANGQITWREGPKIPPYGPPPSIFRAGLQNASAVTVVSGGQTYVYLIGGLRRFYTPAPNPLVSTDAGSNKVYRATVNPANGDLTDWVEVNPIPIPITDDDTGLWNAAAVTVRFDVGGGTLAPTGNAIYVSGGQQQVIRSGQSPGLNTYNTLVYRAVVGAGGALTWSSQPGKGANPQVALPTNRLGMASVSANGKIYFIGGRTVAGNPEGPRDVVVVGVVDDDLGFPEVDAGVYLVGENQKVLPAPRENSTAVVVPATPTPEEPSAAWVLVLGGEDSNGLSNSVFFGKVGGIDESSQPQVVPSGWYYASPLNVRFGGQDVGVQQILWTTTISRTEAVMDIQMQYRVAVTGDGNCDNPAIYSDDAWVDLDGAPADPAIFSQNGPNTVEINPPPVATCFQYRARLSTGNGSFSPSLLNVNLLTKIAGGPDLKPETFTEQRNASGQLLGFNIAIANKNEDPNNQPPQPADFVERLSGNTGASFYVDLCISKPNETIPQPPAPPTSPTTTGPGCTTVYANVPKSALGVGAVYPIGATQWYRYDGPNTPSDQLVNILSYFSQPGEYQIWMVIDSTGLVPEIDGGKANNVRELKFRIEPGQTPSNQTFLPIIRR